MKQTKVNALSYAQLIKYMLEGGYTCAELAELTGLHYVTVLHYTRELYKAGAAHITEWRQDTRGKASVRVYTLGRGRDVKRTPKTPAQRQALARERKRWAPFHAMGAQA
jgi:hypothetical protein